MMLARPSRVAFLTGSLLAAAPACGGSTGSPDTVNDAAVDTGGPTIDFNLDAGTGADAAADQAVPTDSGTSPEAAPPSFTTVPLTSCVPSEYTAEVTIGGTQTFALAIDTGSTTLGVASSMCTSCGVSPTYTPAATATDEHKTGDSQYGTGSWDGEIYDDTVRVGTSRTTPDTFVSIDTQSQFFQPGVRCGTHAGPQGIIGLGPAGSALPATQGFFDALVANEQVPNIFATKLCDGTGTLWLGGFDATATTAAPQYTPLVAGVDQYYYAVMLGSITIGGTSVPIASGQYTDSIVDTGTSVFILPTPAYTTITETIGGNAQFQQIFGFGGTGGDAGADASTGTNGASWFANPNNCVSLSQTKTELDALLPPLTLVFGTDPLISVQAAATESYLITYDGLWCPALLSETPGPDFPLASILGSPVLRSNVVIWDRANTRIGFAPHTPCP